MNSPAELVEKLKENPRVLAVARYGCRGVEEREPGGDLDLFVLLEGALEGVESLHFFVGEIPVDLNLRSREDLAREQPLTCFDGTLAGAEILHDPQGILAEAQQGIEERWARKPGQIGRAEAAALRFSQRHVLDKVRGRTESEPLFCEFLLAANIHWLAQAYYNARGQGYPGDRQALKGIAKEEGAIYELFKRFFAARGIGERLQVTEELTEAVLEPVGGPWHPGEVLALGREEQNEKVAEAGRRLYEELVGT